MNSTTSVSNKPSTRIQWMWKSDIDPFSKSQSGEWKSYSDIENIIIEDALMTAGRSHAVLDNYKIDLKKNIQVSNNDRNKQRPVKRMECQRYDHHSREERFTFDPINSKRPFGGLYGWISPFIREVVKYLKITRSRFPSKDQTTVAMIVEKAAYGIVEEAKLIGKQCQGEQLAKMLLKKKGTGMDEVLWCISIVWNVFCTRN